MKSFSVIFLPALFSVLCALGSAGYGAGNPPNLYSVDGGKILLYAGDNVRSVAAGGQIERHCRGDGGIYYIAIKTGDGASVPCIGFVDVQSGEVRFEKKLSISLNEFALDKFMVSEGIAYILTEPRSSAGSGKTLNRINLNTMEADKLPGILDYHVEGRDLILLAKGASGLSLSCNGITVPITIAGEGLLRISAVMDGRIVFVTNGLETEIVDMRSGKALYGYANNRELQAPDGYNLVIQAEDSPVSEQGEPEMVFYKVFIDGSESGRTESGPANQAREFRIQIEANTFHLVKLERWVRNTAKGRYDRENNIRQPRSENLFIPMNRIVKFRIIFDGKNYHYDTLPVYK